MTRSRWLFLATVWAACAAVGARADDPASRLAAARAALGGEQLLTPQTTFVINGTQRIDTRVAHRSAPFEISCALPDRFVWREESSGRGPTILGFNGRKLIANSSEALDRAVPSSSDPSRPAAKSGNVSVPD